MKRKQDQQNVTSNATDIVENLEVNVLKKRVAELEKHNVGLGEAVDRMTTALNEKDDEIRHLKSMLGGSVPLLVGTQANPLTDEEIIAEQQLQRLKTKAQSGELTLEEVKKFDLLVKNKRLAQGNSTSNPDIKDVTHSMGKKKLLTLAATAIKEDKVEDGSDDE